MKKSYLGLVFLGFASLLYAQGSLTPPGAPGATMKTLDQLDAAIAGVSNQVLQVTDAIEMIGNTSAKAESRIDVLTLAGDSMFEHVISQPGSYYLSGDLEVSGKFGGIWVASVDVTLDLNGFSVSRLSDGEGYGVYITGGGTVCNGNIRGFAFGIYRSGSGARFEKLTVSDCTSAGIRGDSGVRMLDCVAIGNSGSGINVGSSASLSGCIAYGNHGSGIFTGTGASLSDCVAAGNSGFYGIMVMYGSTLSGCSAFDNVGIYSESYGIYAWGATVSGCSAYNNSNTNSPTGFRQGVGISINGGVVNDCMAYDNQGDGILVVTRSVVRGNSSYANGSSGDGAGIHVTGVGNRIEGNNVHSNDRGIDVDDSGNIIVRNTASANTLNWDVVSDNVCLVVQAAKAGAISGNSGGTAPGSTDPNANFTY
ncbi:MAG: right-handed parallel beta-helix repeat-containing protein [Pontiellaceae bacterium]|nr:right-handed parallel beta-helix repeat-containing protein [Pontiellaceae bacterium]MBN2785919.1 right-handed parallel beta-helix repeat-containing protein [Pontiellaceae bacterium]